MGDIILYDKDYVFCRRKDMKDAVHKLRNQLRRKTKKPSTISVLKAAKQEIDVSQVLLALMFPALCNFCTLMHLKILIYSTQCMS